MTVRLLVVVLLLTGALVLREPTPAAAACQQWTGGQPANPGTDDTGLNGVVVRGPCNTYAVGTFRDSGPQTAFIDRFNGSAWRHVTIPTPGASSGLEAVSSSWAVGRMADPTTETLILRRVGASWAQMPSPNPSASRNELYGVAQLGPENAWAVGNFQGPSAGRTLILHWNGTKWRRVSSPNAGDASTENMLFDIDAVNAHDIWAVGLSDQNPSKTLTLHWNGRSWKIVPSPNASSDIFGDALLGVASVSANDAWAAGYFSEASNNNVLILHWNGTKWKRAALSGVPSFSALDDVVAIAPKNVWAVGGAALKNVVLHWNGRTWKRVPVSSPGTSDSFLDAIDGRAGEIWAVGEARDSSTATYFPQALHCC